MENIADRGQPSYHLLSVIITISAFALYSVFYPLLVPRFQRQTLYIVTPQHTPNNLYGDLANQYVYWVHKGLTKFRRYHFLITLDSTYTPGDIDSNDYPIVYWVIHLRWSHRV